MKDGLLFKLVATCFLIGLVTSLFFPTPAMPQVTYTVFFDSNAYFIKESGKKVIKEVAERARSHPELLIVLEGYSDKTGDDAFNLSLSRSRAEAVREQLIEKGVEPQRISVVPLGGTVKFSPEGEGGTLALNRRVEIIISESQVPAATPKAEIQAQPALDPSPAPSPALSKDNRSLYDTIYSSLKEITPYELRFDPPLTMRVGAGEQVEVSVSNSVEKKLILSLKNKDLSGAYGVAISSALRLSLEGANFDIIERKSAQAVSLGDGIWRWNVVPLSSGVQSLVLIASLDVNKPGQGTVRLDFPLMERVVNVKPNPTLAALTLLKKYSGIALSLLFVWFLAWYIKRRWLEG